jgi:hypothetical protein
VKGSAAATCASAPLSLPPSASSGAAEASFHEDVSGAASVASGVDTAASDSEATASGAEAAAPGAGELVPNAVTLIVPVPALSTVDASEGFGAATIVTPPVPRRPVVASADELADTHGSVELTAEEGAATGFVQPTALTLATASAKQITGWLQSDRRFLLWANSARQLTEVEYISFQD